jgi:flagellar hook assembly protein FlgD
VWLKGASAVQVTIRDAANAPVRTVSAQGAAGVNRLEWDIRRDDGRDAPPGVYRAAVTAGGRTVTTDIVVIPGR